MAHTPGPWTWKADEQEVDPRTYKSPGYCDNLELYGGNGRVVISAGGGEYNPLRSSVDDGALIAAAPELLEQLRLAQRMLLQTDWRLEEGHMAEIDAAIAKAEGVQP